ncbi:MAG: N-acetylglucosamine-6-phosphate deacetylase, partial [Oscillospiraceae bacterium]|nr:N-acetylglucosamine-6-phosphate deacetylase [Oscillospiraceae bacterium]
MRIVNAKVFLNGAFVPGGVEFGEQIAAAGPEITGPGDVDAGGCYVIPGLIDIHTHAAVGEDASDGKPEGLPVLSRYYAAGGVTAWCPTTMTLKEPVLTQAMRTIRDFVRPEDGARVAGVNLEGPFLCYAKRGAQAAENLHPPDAALFRRLNEASGGLIRLVTLAPEEPGAMEFIREVAPVATVSLGHTTADYDTAMAAYAAGASHATHLYNAMPSLLHRAPGVIAAASDAGATVELISDGLHVHPAVVRLTHRLFGDKLVLISDSLRCAGMPDGDYTLGGQPITMKNGKATLSGTDTLAGSSIHLMDGLRRAVSFGVPLEAAVTAATLTPARVIRREGEIGSIAPGLWADLVVLDKTLQVKAVYIGGTPVYQRKEK